MRLSSPSNIPPTRRFHLSPRARRRRRARPLLRMAVGFALATGGAAGCESISGPGASGSVPAPILELPRTLSGAETQAIHASNAFGFDLLREVLAEDPRSSVFLSPFSASMALGMTLNGADGETFDAMRATLHFGALSEGEINQAYEDLLALLVGLDPDVELAVGNSVWNRMDRPLREAFRQRVERHFGARVQSMDFADPAAAGVINGWVQDVTRGRIDEMMGERIPANVIAILLNAVYFKAGWTQTFDPSLTQEAPFHLPDGSSVPADLMMREDTFQVRATDRFVAVDLPYAGKAFSMTVVIPREGIPVHDLVAQLDRDRWEEMLEGLATTRAQLWLPRFELEWEAQLNGALAGLGMEVAFGGGADFSRMFEHGNGWIDEVKQKSFVRVDEEGTEAAAATSVVMVESAPLQIRADRPFLFAIRERLSGTVLFLGVMVEAPPRT